MLYRINTVAVLGALVVATVGIVVMAVNFGLFGPYPNDDGAFQAIPGSADGEIVSVADAFAPDPFDEVAVTGMTPTTLRAATDTGQANDDLPVLRVTTTVTALDGRPVVSVEVNEPWWFESDEPKWWGEGSSKQFPPLSVAGGDDD